MEGGDNQSKYGQNEIPYSMITIGNECRDTSARLLIVEHDCRLSLFPTSELAEIFLNVTVLFLNVTVLFFFL